MLLVHGVFARTSDCMEFHNKRPINGIDTIINSISNNNAEQVVQNLRQQQQQNQIYIVHATKATRDIAITRCIGKAGTSMLSDLLYHSAD